MERTIKKLLHQGFAKHKDGKLEEAKHLYLAILKEHPNHPEANHNLGVIALSVNKVDKALTFYKIALEANQKVEQFWLSYINALIKVKNFEDAKQALSDVSKAGFFSENFDTLRIRLKTINNVKEPSQQQLNNLLKYYQTNRFNDAEKLALSITQEYPGHQFGWKVLGVLLGQTGRFTEAVKVNKKAVSISPQDAEAHNNLASTLKEIGRLDEAEISLRQAIALKIDFAEAYNNLGIVLQKLGRLDEAEAIYRKALTLKPDFIEIYNNLGSALQELGKLQEAEVIYREALALKPNHAEIHSNLGIIYKKLGRLDDSEAILSKAITLKPDFAEAHNNLGVTLKEIGKLDEAETSLRQAIRLKLDFAEAYNNLGIILQELGRLDEAETNYKDAIALKPDYAEAILNLSIVLDYMNNIDGSILLLKDIIKKDSSNHRLKAQVRLAIFSFLEDNFKKSKMYLLASLQIQKKLSQEFRNDKIYYEYLIKILEWHKDKTTNSPNISTNKNLYIIGDSHSLAFHGLSFQSASSQFLCKAKLIKGCKQWHLGNVIRNQYKIKFESILSSLPKSSQVILTIGEIDCRLDSGIIKHKKKLPKKDLENLIMITVENYLNYIFNINTYFQHKIIIQGVPCPNINKKNSEKKEIEQLINLINIFNFNLENKAKEKGFNFFDVHKLTDNGNGFSNNDWHIDEYHLSPKALLEAWDLYASKYKH